MCRYFTIGKFILLAVLVRLLRYLFHDSARDVYVYR